jgi:hypothetical protein
MISIGPKIQEYPDIFKPIDPSPLELARKKRKEMIEAGEKVERLDPIQKAAQKPGSLRLAVNAKCWDCVGAGADPNPRGLIRDCTCGSSCPLYSVRPYQAKKTPSTT